MIIYPNRIQHIIQFERTTMVKMHAIVYKLTYYDRCFIKSRIIN